MNDQYLWDRTGKVDPDVAELERLLSPLAHDGRPLDAAGRHPLRRARPWPCGRSSRCSRWRPPSC